MSGTYTCERCGYQSPDVGDMVSLVDGTGTICTSCAKPQPVNLCDHVGALQLRQREEYHYDHVAIVDGVMVVSESDNELVETGYRHLWCSRCSADLEIPEEENWT